MTYIKIILAATIFLLASCSDSPSEITDQVKGEYKFKYPSGQLEILKIKDNNKFDHFIYYNESDFLKKAKPQYENSGSWGNEGEKLSFTPWLSICYLGSNVDSILAKPQMINMSGVLWYEPTREHNGRLLVYDQNGYIFQKID